VQIRREQMKALQQGAISDLACRLAADLREKLGGLLVLLPERAVPLSELQPRELEAMVRQCLERALDLGFNGERDLAKFTTLCFLLGPRFDAIPAFQNVIADSRIPVDRRLEEIYTRTTEKDWEQATEAYKRHVWGGKSDSHAP
jgi:hypothetical protein